MDVDLCEHGDIAVACLDCLAGKPPERPNTPRPALVVESAAFPARYPGHCNGCNLEIHEDQLIVRMSDETYRHRGCSA